MDQAIETLKRLIALKTTSFFEVPASPPSQGFPIAAWTGYP